MKLVKKTKICNVVCTGNLEQKIKIKNLSKLSHGIYSKKIYNGICGYVKTPEMDGRVTIFPSGKMISIGGKSIKKSIEQLNKAKLYLIKEKMINKIQIKPKIRNIVAVAETDQKIPIEKLSLKIKNANYTPETFSGMILKGMNSCSFLIFASGKIIVAGTKSLDELSTSVFDLLQLLNKSLD